MGAKLVLGSRSCFSPVAVMATIAWVYLPAHQCPADEGQYDERVQVKAPTRLDWTFAATRRSLTDPPADLVGSDYDSTQQTYEFYGPGAPSDFPQGLPLILYISPKDHADGWHHWEEVCRQNGYCFAGPHNAGAQQPIAKRIRVILDVLDDVRRRQLVDPDRTYIAGWGEGAHMACELGYSLPECFGGIIAIGGGEAPPVPRWMRRRIAERLSVVFLSVETGIAATFTDVLFRPMAASIGAESIHWQRFVDKPNRPGHDLFHESVLWVDQGVFRRRETATKYPSTRLGVAGPYSREKQARNVLAEAKRRLADEATVDAGLRELEGLQQRWPDLPPAASARSIRLEFEARENRPWEDQRSKERLSEVGVTSLALMHVHWKFKGIKAHLRLRSRAGRRRNYMEDYVVMNWSDLAINRNDGPNGMAQFDKARFNRKTIEIARRMGGMIALDRRGRVNKLSLGGTRVTSKQLKTVKQQLDGLEGLRVLELSSALMQESALSQVAGFTKLRALNLNHVEITNRGLSHLAELDQLQYLGLAFTDVSNLRLLRSLRELRQLILGGSRIKDAALKQLGSAKNLRQLSLFSCEISDAGVARLIALPDLSFLNLASTKVSDAGCASIAKMESLEELVLDETRVTDDGLKMLVGLDKLRHLSLESLQITDQGLAFLDAASGLESVNVAKTRVTAQGVASFQSALPACRVQWNGDPTRYRTQQRLQRAVDTFHKNELEARRFALRELQRQLLGVCLRSGEGLSID